MIKEFAADAKEFDRPVPAVSVVMPARNALPFLDEAIGSVLAQTFHDFEFVILDDASTDGTGEALRRWAARDRRIRLFESSVNLGPVQSSNYVVHQARAPLIARMDADDILMPHRLERQVELMKKFPLIALVASLYEGIDATGRRIRTRECWRLTKRSPFSSFAHDSILFRREVFDVVGGYRDGCDYWEDLDLYWRISRAGLIAVMPDALLLVRYWKSSTRVATDPTLIENAVDLCLRCSGEYMRGLDYDALIAHAKADPPTKVMPGAFTSRGASLVWAGASPRILNRMISRMKFRFDLPTVKTIVWALWGTVSPKTLRWVVGQCFSVLNRIASYKVRDGSLYEWPTGNELTKDMSRVGEQGPELPKHTACAGGSRGGLIQLPVKHDRR